jgi:glutaminase
MSVSKPLLFALICETIGPEKARAKLGGNATGLPFNSLAKITANPLLPKEIKAQVDLGNITCVSNDQLRSVMEKTTATPQQVQEPLRVNTEARAACAEYRTVEGSPADAIVAVRTSFAGIAIVCGMLEARGD